MNRKSEKEVIEQLKQLGASEPDAEQTAREICETEHFLRRQDSIEPSPAFMQRLESQLREKLAGASGSGHTDKQSMPTPAFVGRRDGAKFPVWLKRVGSVAAAAAIVFIAIIAFRGNQKESTHPSPGPPPPKYVMDTPELWELELVEFEEPVLQVDDLVISEVLELWTEADWDIENLFGKENDDEAARNFASMVGSRDARKLVSPGGAA